MSHASYLNRALQSNSRRKAITKATQRLSGVGFDAIVVCGVGGLTFGSALAHAMNKDIVVVRKEEDQDNHSSHRVEWGGCGTRALLVDDMISSGGTMGYIESKLRDHATRPDKEFKLDIVGYYLYCLDMWEGFHKVRPDTQDDYC